MNLLRDPSLSLQEKARQIRIAIISSIYHAKNGHAGSSLSTVEVLTYLYSTVLRYAPDNPGWCERDWVVFSKGHGSPALYATLALAGFFDASELLTLRKLGSRLQGHPKAGLLPGVDVSTGSLGQGLSIAVGLALGFRRKLRSNRVFCILGDGEMQEGQNWEAMMAAASFGLNNLIAIVDRNGLQNDGPTEEIVKLGDLVAKAKAFDWHAESFDGHNFDEIAPSFDRALGAGCPAFLVANTIKGKGVSFMEGIVHWHHHPIGDLEYSKAMAELTGSDD